MIPAVELFVGLVGAALCLGAAAVVIALHELLHRWDRRSKG
jgi:hypothetical protein